VEVEVELELERATLSEIDTAFFEIIRQQDGDKMVVIRVEVNGDSTHRN